MPLSFTPLVSLLTHHSSFDLSSFLYHLSLSVFILPLHHQFFLLLLLLFNFPSLFSYHLLLPLSLSTILSSFNSSFCFSSSSSISLPYIPSIYPSLFPFQLSFHHFLLLFFSCYISLNSSIFLPSTPLYFSSHSPPITSSFCSSASPCLYRVYLNSPHQRSRVYASPSMPLLLITLVITYIHASHTCAPSPSSGSPL